MAENSGAEPAQKKRKNGPGRPFYSGDPRINSGGRPKAVKELLEVARGHAPRAIALAASYLDEQPQPDLDELERRLGLEKSLDGNPLAEAIRLLVAEARILRASARLDPRVRMEAVKFIASYGLGSPPKQSDDEFSEMTDEQMVEAVLDAVPFEAILAAYRRRAETQGAPRTNQ